MGNSTSSERNVIPLKDNTTATTLFKQEPECCSKQVTYRIPALIYISKDQTYLAFTEKRKTEKDTDAEVLVMRRGSWKDGKNEVEWVSGYQVLSACLPNHRSMNPCPVYERDSETLFLFFICVPNGVSENDQIKEKKNRARLCYVTSKDTGKTWSCITDLKDVISEKEKNWATFAVGPGHGVQMKNGRLIIPAYTYYFKSKCNTPTSHAFAFYSDDKGNTWHVGEHMDGESNECQMAEIIDDEGNSTLYSNSRGTSGYRVEALSKNGGEDFDKPSSAQELIETGERGCQGSVLNICPDQSTWLIYSHPSDKKKRKDLGIYINKLQKDHMQWKTIQCISDGPSGYSDLAECKDRKYIACLFECGQKREIEKIAFKLFNISNALDNQ
ncbi:sialidase-3-like [Megalobrama amblycephala]|uniref:sialidase-3-like n=1 Tax=Megalobrama amblycephala TaxID=75352 RepID=UPI0020144FC1|nr:sialidase-3-like [Megalobrama amblycephala]XP_048036370.1 sialidase-3-like [Megalobrama amblycephala]